MENMLTNFVYLTKPKMLLHQGAKLENVQNNFQHRKLFLKFNFHTKFDRSNFFQIENAELLFSLKYHESNRSIFLR